MLSRVGREGEEEVAGGKVNYDLMPENILKGGYHGVCINLRVQVLICQSYIPEGNSGGLRISIHSNFTVYFML